ncbi:uncharacterized protein CANTADRAFT_143333 [Suhomyces tanzawaensis NRRL Y-17324]|uniref:Uncharacterized protein n=1 Tax=Suhomyces tanzawaensis NRRL Y-17324 TaxID=984487 RepID=A0A1E4SS82_9ASCO|nr:uncharacterized protein CANTADRAFT_143333 [Suhomyces tanzawaensis NRRL Y-17324]ODV82373.1 hypothetical protein CANTADRAFT_143333 [Suhomyces tanzawaensis NRRL Y-17324]
MPEVAVERPHWTVAASHDQETCPPMSGHLRIRSKLYRAQPELPDWCTSMRDLSAGAAVCTAENARPFCLGRKHYRTVHFLATFALSLTASVQSHDYQIVRSDPYCLFTTNDRRLSITDASVNDRLQSIVLRSATTLW